MRVLFTTFASPSHYFPMVPLGWALRLGGHSVWVACQPSFTERVMQSGLPAVATGRAVDIGSIWRGVPATANSHLEHQRQARLRADRAMTMFATVAEAMADDLIAVARAWRPDLVVYEPRAYAGLLAGQVLGIPVVRHLWGTDYTYSRWKREWPALEPLWRKYRACDADPLGALTVDLCPPSLQVPSAGSRRLMRYVPYNGPGMVPAWLLEPPSRPRVCVTWGTTFGATAGHVSPARLAIEAVAGLDVEGVIAVSAAQRHLLGEVPASLRVVESMPLHLLLPTCAAVVHQGGAGTTITAAVCGTPQLVVPTIADEPLNAQRIAACRAGLVVEQWTATPGRIRDALVTLLEDPAHRQAAERLRHEAERQPGPTELVAALEALAR